MKSTSISKAYNNKDERDELGIKVQKTYFVEMAKNSIYIEDGFNVRDLDADHVASIAEAYEAGKYVPAIVVKPTPQGLKVIDGHHRFAAAVKAKVEAVEVKNFVGDESDELAFMITSSQGRNLSPIERAQAYQRLVGRGLSPVEISKLVGRSKSDVTNHLTLMTASPQIVEAVKSGQLGYAAAVEEINRNGFAGEEKIKKQLATGEKVTRTTLAGFKKSDHNTMMDILVEFEARFSDCDLPETFYTLLNKWKEV